MSDETASEVFQQKARDLEAMMLKLSMARGLDEIMAVVRSGARALVAADGVTFVLRDRDKCFYADEDAIAPLWKGQRFPLETCISGWAMLNRTPAIIPDIYLDDRIPHAAYRPTFVKSLVMTPVRQEDPVAAIGAYWAKSFEPASWQIDLLQRIANSAAVAMTNVGLYNALVEARREEERLKDAIIFALAALAETRHQETGNHIYRTQHYVRVLAEAARERELFPAELTIETADMIFKSAPLHDIGKVGIADSILLKPGPLTAEEYDTMKLHPEIGHKAVLVAERQLGPCKFLDIVKDVVLSHHERWDGTGYPHRLAGAAIPLAARFMAVADVYDALVSRRVYKAPVSHDQAVAVIQAERAHHFDPDLVDTFLAVADQFDAVHRRFADGDIASQTATAFGSTQAAA